MVEELEFQERVGEYIRGLQIPSDLRPVGSREESLGIIRDLVTDLLHARDRVEDLSKALGLAQEVIDRLPRTDQKKGDKAQ